MIPNVRAWDKVNKEMIEDVASIHFKAEMIVTRNLCFYPFKDIERLQSTGLLDKNGVEIYDKDIVRDSYGDVFLIEWLESCFILTESYGDYDHSFLDDLSFYEVVGNQFEHPNLLGED